jgi:hypothetical protein
MTTKRQRIPLRLPARIRRAAKRAGLKSLRGTLI